MCLGSCRLEIASFIDFWIWESPSDAVFKEVTAIVATQTVVEVINSSLNTTATHTLYPPGMTPLATNSAGTRVATVTYSRQGQNHTTILVFPTGFINWPDSYAWEGTLSTERTPGITDCVTASVPQTSALPSNPQPEAANFFPPSSGHDPYGSGYSLISGEADTAWFYPDTALFTDQAAIQQCASLGDGPNIAPYTITNWTTISSTSFESTGESSTSPAIVMTSAIENTPSSLLGPGSAPTATSATQTTNQQSTGTATAKNEVGGFILPNKDMQLAIIWVAILYILY
ncbi:hypothetical protein F5Y10DRAFT_255915 [Nemania abortiva]|nr:hypothetical protein F5Y10DRAFT_255915 [Nemania abortiva]